MTRLAVLLEDGLDVFVEGDGRRVRRDYDAGHERDSG
jgi:hypothetical protein